MIGGCVVVTGAGSTGPTGGTGGRGRGGFCVPDGGGGGGSVVMGGAGLGDGCSLMIGGR